MAKLKSIVELGEAAIKATEERAKLIQKQASKKKLKAITEAKI